jgi:NAD(P)H-nitrite reductase large subunit
MEQKHYVIVGNGPAAESAAITLREEAPDCRISMFGKQAERNYKPHLLPDYVAGKITKDDLFVQPLDFYKSAGIKLRLGQNVMAVNLFQGTLVLDHKEIVPYDGLIIATGSIPRIPEPLYAFQDLMMTLKTIVDADVWRSKLSEIDSVLLVGGDLTSLSFARALLHLGKKVTFMLDEDSFWPVRLGSDVFFQAAERLSSRGVDVLECRKIKSICQCGENQIEVETEDRKLQVGAVGAFFGLIPDVRFLAKSGLHIERGILVDEFLATHFNGVFAAGDCAQVYHPDMRDYWVSIGYKNAKHLGRVAALNLAGGMFRADTVPRSIFKIEGITVNTSWWTEF